MKYNKKVNQFSIIGELCKEYRLDHDISLVEVAHESGTSPSNISKFESGENDNYNILIVYILFGFDLTYALKKIGVIDNVIYQ